MGNTSELRQKDVLKNAYDRIATTYDTTESTIAMMSARGVGEKREGDVCQLLGSEGR